MGQSSGIGVLDKAVKVLRASAVAPLGLADLCATTGLPRATAHRLAVGLEVHGLLTRDQQGRWRPGPLLAVLAAGAPDPLVQAASEVLPRLRDRTGESVQVYRPDGLARVCVAVSEPAAGLRDTVPLGARLGAVGGRTGDRGGFGVRAGTRPVRCGDRRGVGVGSGGPDRSSAGDPLG